MEGNKRLTITISLFVLAVYFIYYLIHSGPPPWHAINTFGIIVLIILATIIIMKLNQMTKLLKEKRKDD
ncbi:putative membrane protein [Evansella vedderi]|uniref:Membrane protein n=1 Tax=Evansella vedderi TaxID=38282 RepID=A0ABT9ZN74_9BACI|nr:hypothetical protein [Evansella vedderi]MDQ0252681.1 putative membrane protein [Evansella vedderi]